MQNVTPSIICLHDELYIILKRRNLDICEHSSFFQLLNHNIFFTYISSGCLKTLIGINKCANLIFFNLRNYKV